MILVFLYLKYKNQCIKLIEEHWGDRERGSIPTHQSLSEHFYTLRKAIFSKTGQCCCLLITFPLEISTLSSEQNFWTELVMRWSLSHCSLDTFLLEQEHSLYTRVHKWLALCLGISAALYNEAKGRLSDGKTLKIQTFSCNTWQAFLHVFLSYLLQHEACIILAHMH